MIIVMFVIIVSMALALCCMRDRVSACSEVLLLRQVNGRVEDTQSQREQDEQENESSRLLRCLIVRMDHALEPSGGGRVPRTPGPGIVRG